jgi:hypothetical protein
MTACPNCGAHLQVGVVAAADEEIQVCLACGFELLRIRVDAGTRSVVSLPPLLRDDYDRS